MGKENISFTKLKIRKAFLKIKQIDIMRFIWKSNNPVKYILFPVGIWLLLLSAIGWLLSAGLAPNWRSASTIIQLGYGIGCILEIIRIILWTPLFLIYFIVPNFINKLVKVSLISTYPFENVKKCLVINGNLFCIKDIFITLAYVFLILYIGHIIWYFLISAINSKTNNKAVYKSKLSERLKLLSVCKNIKKLIIIPLKRALLSIIIPILFTIMAGYQDFAFYTSAFSKDTCPDTHTATSGWLGRIITGELINMYKKDNKKSKLEKKFGSLDQYITSKEWKEFKCSLPMGALITKNCTSYSPNLFILERNYKVFDHDKRNTVCKYDKNGLGREETYYYCYYAPLEYYFDANSDEKLRKKKECFYKPISEYKCPKYKDYITQEQCINRGIFAQVPKRVNTFFSDTIYIGIYEELLYAFNGKIYSIIEEIAKRPCYYRDEQVNSSYKERVIVAHDYQCNIPQKNRQLQYVKIYVYDKNSKIINNITFERED